MNRFHTIRDKRTTTQRGYGSDHQKTLAYRRPRTRPTDPCPHCGQPLGPERQPGDTRSRWALPHNATRTGYLPGMAHASCNQRDGARRGGTIGRRVQNQRRAQPLTSQHW